MNIFSVAFWKNALEAVLLGGAIGFTSALPASGTNVNSINWKAAGIGAGVGAIYAFVKQLGAVQSANATAGAAHAAPVGESRAVAAPPAPGGPQ